jgi:hypothetical protein|tara:strand:+ start:666 stop:827 length:162 start_codon:yes stop_codon:yes gene_type:complete
MGYEDLANINRVIEFIHEYKNCGLKESGKLDNFNLAETLALLEVVREELIDNI